MLAAQPDERLAALARSGSEQAFAAIVERYRRELYGFACRLRSDGRAEDLVQQTFLSAFAALRSGTEVTHLRGWLYRILRNEATRSSAAPIAEVELDPSSIATEPLEDATHRRMLALEALSSIAALPDRQRDVMVGTVLSGQSRAAVADAMGVSEGAVRQLMHRARATLRAAVAAIAPGPAAGWLAALRTARGGETGAEIALGAGTASAGGIAVKLGVVLATGAVATGVVGSQLISRHGHPAAPRARAAAAGAVAHRDDAHTPAGRAAQRAAAPGARPAAARRLADAPAPRGLGPPKAVAVTAAAAARIHVSGEGVRGGQSHGGGAAPADTAQTEHGGSGGGGDRQERPGTVAPAPSAVGGSGQDGSSSISGSDSGSGSGSDGGATSADGGATAGASSLSSSGSSDGGSGHDGDSADGGSGSGGDSSRSGAGQSDGSPTGGA